MINALILDDNGKRVTEIKKLLYKYRIDVKRADTLEEARAIYEMMPNIDMVIVDLLVPTILSSQPNSENGRQFIEEILNDENIKRPKHIIVVSEYLDKVEYLKKLYQYPIAVIDTNNDRNWQDDLDKLLCVLCPIQVDVAIITAVKIEFDAIYNDEWQEELTVGRITFYRRKYVNKDSKHINAILVQAEDMGMVAASYTISLLFKYYCPTQVFMIGIAGGNSKRNLGDIIIANTALDYSLGAIKETETKQFEFESQPKSVEASACLVNIFKTYEKKKLHKQIQAQMNSKYKIDNDIEIIIGNMATGPAVIKSKEYVKNFIEKYFRQYDGIDMETYPIYYFCKKIGSVDFLSIKSVCDHADIHKNDLCQKYCANIVAWLLEYYIKNDFKVNDTM